jgi:hypothetical protein
MRTCSASLDDADRHIGFGVEDVVGALTFAAGDELAANRDPSFVKETSSKN